MSMDRKGAAAPTPALYPIRFDPRTGAVQWIELDEAGYRAASFLDERLLQSSPPLSWEPWSTVEQAAQRAVRGRNFIFHVGHVGSTLLSRLLDEHPAVMSVREPAILRTLAIAGFEASAGRDGPAAQALGRRTDLFLRLFSRTWRPEQTALIKATSFVSGMADQLMDRSPGGRAICLTVTPMAYLRGILGGSARTEIAVMALSRLGRLSARLGPLGWSLDAMSEGEVVAMSWLCEMTALHDAATQRSDDMLWLDFDQMLAAPEIALASAFAHLGVAADDERIAAIIQGPTLKQYSKATDYAYSAQARRDTLAQAERDHGAGVRKGVEWLGRTAQASPLAKAVLLQAARIRL